MHKGHINGSIYCIYHQLKYSSPNHSKKQKTRATQKSLPFGKWGFREFKKRSGEWATSRKG